MSWRATASPWFTPCTTCAIRINPTRVRHDKQLDVLVRAADELITLDSRALPR